jgi:hypothetical protein
MVTAASAEASSAACEAEEQPYLEAEGARVYAGAAGGVLVVRVYPGESGLPVAVKVDGYPVTGEAGMRPRGRHRRNPESD